MFSSVPHLPLEFVEENCMEDGCKHPKIDTFHLYLEITLEVRILFLSFSTFSSSSSLPKEWPLSINTNWPTA